MPTRFPFLLGVVVSHSHPLRDFECTPDWFAQRRRTPAGLKSPAMTRLLDADNQSDMEGVLAFIYFLAQIAGHTNAWVA